MVKKRISWMPQDKLSATNDRTTESTADIWSVFLVLKKKRVREHYNRYCVGNLYNMHTWISFNSILALHTQRFFSIKETRLCIYPSQRAFDLNQTSVGSSSFRLWSDCEVVKCLKRGLFVLLQRKTGASVHPWSWKVMAVGNAGWHISVASAKNSTLGKDLIQYLGR